LSGFRLRERAAVDPDLSEDECGTAALAGPDDPGRDRRLPWAELFQRVWREDLLVCPRCGGEMRSVAVLQDPAVCEKILRHLGLWQRGPPRVPRVVMAPAELA
jgi:hypothetical protein